MIFFNKTVFLSLFMEKNYLRVECGKVSSSLTYKTWKCLHTPEKNFLSWPWKHYFKMKIATYENPLQEKKKILKSTEKLSPWLCVHVAFKGFAMEQ